MMRFVKKARRGGAAPPAETAPAPDLGANVPTLQDILAPDGFDRRGLDVFRMGRYWIRSLFVTAFPRVVDIGWLAPLIGIRHDIDLAVHILPLDNRAATDALSRIIARLEAERGLSDGNVRMVQELDTAIQDAWSTRERLAKNYGKLYHVSTVANLYATSLEDLEDQQTVLEGELAKRHIHTRYAEARMDDGFLAAGPLGVNLLDDTYRLMDSMAVSTMFPFTHADLVHPGGYPIGLNMQTQSPVFYNPQDPSLDNRNMVIYATSGAGKTATARTLIGREAVMGIQTAVLDPEGEYEPVLQALGGAVVHIGSPDSVLNPLELWPQTEDDGRLSVAMTEKILDFLQLLRMMIPAVTPTDEALAEAALQAEYQARGITADPNSLFDSGRQVDAQGRVVQGRRHKVMPTLTDWYNRFCALAQARGITSRIPDEFPRYLRGSALGFFDGPTTVDLHDAPIIAFDTLLLENPVARPIGIQVALNWLWQAFILGRPTVPKRLIIDEAWRFVDYEPTMDFLENLVRRVRKRNAGVTIISQDYGRFASHPKTQAINSNCSTQILLKQKPSELPILQEGFSLSAGEIAILRQLDKGEALLRTEKLTVQVQILPAPQEEAWVFAKPTRTARRSFAMAEMDPPTDPSPAAPTTEEVVS